jgi:hypothetical protein
MPAQTIPLVRKLAACVPATVIPDNSPSQSGLWVCSRSEPAVGQLAYAPEFLNLDTFKLDHGSSALAGSANARITSAAFGFFPLSKSSRSDFTLA